MQTNNSSKKCLESHFKGENFLNKAYILIDYETLPLIGKKFHVSLTNEKPEELSFNRDPEYDRQFTVLTGHEIESFILQFLFDAKVGQVQYLAIGSNHSFFRYHFFVSLTHFIIFGYEVGAIEVG